MCSLLIHKYIIYVCLSYCFVVSVHAEARAVALGQATAHFVTLFLFSCIIKKLKLLAMYKIIMLQETDYMKIYFPLHETDRKSINPDVLLHGGERGDGDWLQLLSLVQPYITAEVCDSM